MPSQTTSGRLQNRCNTCKMSPAMDRLWGIAIVVTVATFLCAILGTNSAFFFARFTKEYDGSHEAASWPFTIAAMMIHLVGWPIYVAQHHVPLYCITLCGSVLTWLGLMSTVFSKSSKWITFAVGFVHGSGVGVLQICLSMYTMDYFEKFRGTVSGLKSVGWTSSGLVLPIILSALTDIYNIYDTLVLLGAFTMNITPIVFLLKRPEQTMSLPCFDTPKTNLVKRQTCKTPLVEQKHKLPTANVNIHECEGAEIKVGSPDSRVNSAAGRSKIVQFLKDRFSFCKDFRMADATGAQLKARNPDKNDDDHKSSVSTSESSYPKWSQNSEAQNKYPSSGNTAPLNTLSAGLKRMKRDLHSQRNSGCRTGPSQAQYSGSSPWNNGETKNNIPAPSLTGTKSLWLSLRSVFLSPALYVILSAYVLYDFTYTVIITTIVAYALDKGLPMLAAESLIMYGAAATITGCLISPLVWDTLAFSGYSLVVWNLLVKTTCLALLPVASAYGHVTVLVVGTSLASGTILAIKPVLVADYLGVEMLTVTWGLLGAFLVPVHLVTPSIIGYFRDQLGSFDNLYRLLAGLDFLIALIVLCLACQEKYKTGSRNTGPQ